MVHGKGGLKMSYQGIMKTRSQNKNGIEQSSVLDFIMISKEMYPHRIGTSDHFLIETTIENLGLIRNRIKERFSSKKINEKCNRDMVAKFFCEEVLMKEKEN